MKPEQLKYGLVENPRVRLTRGKEQVQLRNGEEVDLRWSDEARHYLLRSPRGVAVAEPMTRHDHDLLHDVCVRNVARVVWVADARADEVILQTHAFQLALRMGSTIGVDEQTLEKVRKSKLNKKARTPKDLVGWLDDQCLLTAGPAGEARAFLSAGADPGKGDLDAFVLHGRSIRVHVRRVPSQDGEGHVLVAARVARSRGKTNQYPIAHVEGELRFSDATVSAWAREEGSAELQQLVAGGTSFLDLWAKYGELEAGGILEEARAIGPISYRSWEHLPNGDISFDVGGDPQAAEKLSKLDGDSQLDAGSEVPAILSNPALTWAEFEASQNSRARRSSAAFHGELVGSPNVDRKTLRLRSTFSGEERPPVEGYLYPSIQGDQRRLERRRIAEERIRNLQCNLPIAHLLVGARVPVPRRKDLPALSVRVRDKLFRDHPPTAQQEEAIRVALNTPDIAVIQGPPGTGKTKVIEAIVERLNDELDTAGAGAGEILVTGFQHDAVENALNRIDVHGLPAIKFGFRQSRDEYERSQARVDQWVRERATQIRERLPSVARSDLHRWLTSALQGYLLAPGSAAETARLLEQLVSRVQGQVSTNAVERVRAVADLLSTSATRSTETDSETKALERAIRALRFEPIGFADDGPRNAQRLLTRLQKKQSLGGQYIQLLEQAASWLDAKPPPFLSALARARRALLLEVVPDRTAGFSTVATRRDVVEAIAAVRKEIEQRHLASRSAPDVVVANYLDQLENNAFAVRKAVIHYSSVFGATCQQAASKVVADVKPTLDYDTVLIDEAARSNPLDLFIPMAQARRRVILVGDHRQLPHIIDRRIQREIEAAISGDKSVASETKEFIEKSLFEHVFRDLGSRIDPRRVVTLDVQFRMHPLLGAFVSKEFYEAEGEPQIKSGLPERAFAHDLPEYAGLVAAWRDVPPELGRERPDRSKSRSCEAKAVAQELKRLLDSPASAGLTFGCITFYSSQVEAICSALVQHDVTVKVGDHSYEVTQKYRDLRLPSEEGDRVVERLRIGTVDAFQGKEFDVVLLSAVRSNDHADGDEKERRKRYGHLMSPNRLCVSMSRQKRMLVVFGDASLLEAPHAEEAIGPLVRFHRELCGGEHGRVL